MGPYLAFAAAGSLYHAFTAVLMPPSCSDQVLRDSSLVLYPYAASGNSGCERR